MINLGQYHRQRCPICAASIEVDKPVERCPACKEYIFDKLHLSGDGTGLKKDEVPNRKKQTEGMNTARTSGPGLVPLNDLEQDIF